MLHLHACEAQLIGCGVQDMLQQHGSHLLASDLADVLLRKAAETQEPFVRVVITPGAARHAANHDVADAADPMSIHSLLWQHAH